MAKKLSGNVALVTGGTSGIGFATALRFVEEGAVVYITGRRQAELDAAVKKIGDNIFGVRGEVSSPSTAECLKFNPHHHTHTQSTIVGKRATLV